MNRRNFLSKLSAMGISGATLQYMTKDALAEVTDDPKDEVPRLRYLRHKEEKTIGEPPEREPVYEAIPRDRWERIEGANEAFSQIKGKIRTETKMSGVDVWVTTHSTMERSVKS